MRAGARDPVVIGLLAAAAVLLLTNLGNGLLWQDEAETALLARNVLSFGYPRAFDGRNYIELVSHGYGPGEAWLYSPWLPFYVLAGVFALLGESTAVARLPFALCGFSAIFLAWRLTRYCTANRWVQRLTVALLTFSVPFLLHMRQCRYYSMTTALFLGSCLAYLRFRERASWPRALILAFMLVLLFHTNFGTFVPTLGAIMLHHLWRGRAEARRRFAAMLVAVAGLTLPWVVFFYQRAFIGAVTPERLGEHLEYYIRVTNKYLVPLVFMGLATAVGWLTTRWQPWRRVRELLAPEPARFLALVVAAQLAWLLVPEQRHMRYVIPVVPLLFIVEAAWAVALCERVRGLGQAAAALMVFTSVLHHGQASVPLVDLGFELTHDFIGPMEGVVRHLEAHARPGDVVKIPYDDRTVIFYTDLTVERPSQFMQPTDAEWIVIRRGWTPARFFHTRYFKRIEQGYERVDLDAPDTFWQNREDPGTHHFRTAEWAPRLVIFRKRRPERVVMAPGSGAERSRR